MGNEPVSVRYRMDPSNDINRIRNSFIQNYHESKQEPVNTLKPPKSKRKTRVLPTCPICMEKVSKSIKLKKCQHLICHSCLNRYILSNLKNITKYPMRCFMNECDELLDITDIESALNNNKEQLSIYDKFSILCAISPDERDQCPQCEMVYFAQSKWLREKSKPFKWIQDDQRTSCANKSCQKKFFGVFIRRHHCRICGEIFCDECSQNVLPLDAASNDMVAKWIKSHKSHNKRKTNWMQSISAISSSTALDDESDSLINVDGKGVDSDEKYDDSKVNMKSLSENEKDLIKDEIVRCCYLCWLDYYRAICANCDYVYCVKCRQPWHDGFDCEQIKNEKKAINLKKKLNDAQSEELMIREGWRRCPGCSVWVARTEGCNHMQHEKCPNPNDGNVCHFCYLC